jgi:Flp pilus assembly protein TadG
MDRLRPKRGYTLVWMCVVMVLLMGLASLAVDYGHVQVVKTQLRRAADAAARYAATGMPFGASTAQAWALAAAADNAADGSPIVLDSTKDVEFGTWSSGTFTVVGDTSTASAIRITARRTASRSNAVTLAFAPVLGQSTCNVHGVSVVQFTSGYGVVGLASIAMGGNSSIGYWSATGGTVSHRGSIASNGTITLSGSTSIDGDAHPGIGHSVSGSSAVNGSVAPLVAPLSYPNGSAGSYAATNDNANLNSGYFNSATRDFNLGGNNFYTIPAGNYYVNNFATGAQATIWVSGQATIYVTGSINLGGATFTASNLPKNLKIVVIGAGTVKVNNNASLYADVYAPQSAVTLSGTGDIYGSVLGNTISMTGTSGIHYDLSLPGGWGIKLVQ